MRSVGMILAAVAIAVAGCSSTEGPVAAPKTTAPAATTSAAPSSTSNANAPLPPGSEIVIGGNNGAISARVTMYSVTQEAAPGAPKPPGGGHWAAADVKTCLDKTDVPFTVSWDVWSVTDANYGSYRASNLTYNQFPRPLYPFSEETVAVGDCVRGSILFPVPDGVTVTRVKYAPNKNVTASWSAS
ncbi:hypothetical protein [Nocardia gipuzkoensis]